MTPMIGAIFAFGFNYNPYGWMLCNGQSMSIANYQALYSLLGTTFGGNGTTTFNLPDLRGRTPIGTGQGAGLPNYTLGQAGGSETVTLTANNLPVHTHVGSGVVPVTTAAAANNVPVNGNMLATASFSAYATGAAGGPMAATTNTSGSAGTGLPISILNPYTTVNYCIAVEGIYPSRN